jgi:hypothetical protein
VYLVLDYVNGWTLAEWRERKHPTVHELLCVFVKIAAALAYMHSRGVLHRDLKLANVVIRKSDGEPIIIDLGCASHTLADDLTEEGLPPGTDRSRAPQQFQFLREHKEEHRARYAFQVSDEIFAYGVMLYDLLTDPRPTEERPREPLNSSLRSPPPAHELNPRVPVAVSDWVESLLARNPGKRPVDTEALRREAAELAAVTSAEYLETVHLPSEQRQPAPAEAGKPVALEKTRKRPWVTLRLVAAAVAVALALWLWRGEVLTPAPSSAPRVAVAPPPATARPMAQLGNVAAMSTPAPARAVDTGPAATADTQKEGSPVTTQEQEAPRQASTPRAEKKPPSAALCKTLSFLVAVAAGCTGVPIRPEPFKCPERARAVMEEQHGWTSGYWFELSLDDRFEWASEEVILRPGAEVVGLVPPGLVRSDEQEKKGPPTGTRFWGRVYVDPQDEEAQFKNEPAALLVKYERMKLPGQEEVPVCIIARSPKVFEVAKDGAARFVNAGEGRVTAFYPYKGL